MFIQFFKNLFGGHNNDAALADTLTKNPLLLDVRTASEFAGGSVPGAVNIPLQELPRRLHELRGREHIVVFCRSGHRSGMAKSILNQHGFSQVINGGSWNHVNQFSS